MKGYAGTIVGGLGMLFLILDSRTALLGATEGLELCIRTVVPSLFPFILLSNLILGQAFGDRNGLRLAGRIFSLPAGSESLLIPAFAGGYPVGAQCIGKAYSDKMLSRQEAQRLLSFCSNAGPSFLFGMVGPLFAQRWVPWVLWGIMILSGLMVSTLFPSEGTKNHCSIKQKNSKPIMAASLWVMGQICGWVVFFRVLIAFLERWCLWILPNSITVAVMGILELSNGCLALGSIESFPLRFVLCAGMLSFGGICVGLQTSSVIGELSMDTYWIGKLLQTLFSLLLAGTVMGKGWAGGVLVLIYFALVFRKTRKNSSIPAFSGV